MTVNPRKSLSDSLSLLIVDDDEVVLKASRQYLSTLFPFHVDTALSGNEALACMAEHQYDVIVADYEMRGMSGLDLLKQIRSCGNDIPFIMFTGKGREEVVIASIDNGADGYVQKGGEIRSQFAELSQKITTVVKKRRAEKALFQSESEYRQLYNESPLAYISVDRSGTIVRCNTKAGELLGRSPDTLTGTSSQEIYADLPGGRNRFIKIFETFLNGGENTDRELIIRRSDGTHRWVTLSMEAIRDEAGHIILSNSILHDITDQKRAEHDLQKAQKHLRDIHRQACIGIWDWDMGKDRIFWSDELYQIIGWNPDLPPPGYSGLSQLYVPESWARLQAAVTTVIETGKPYDLELELFHPDKIRIWVRATGGPVYESTGMLAGLHGTMQDITRRKRDAHKIGLYAKRLEALLNLNHIAEAQEKLIFDYALEASREITESQYSFFGFLDADESIMTIHSWSRNAMTGCEMPLKPIEYPIETAGIWGEAVRSRSSVIINDYSGPHPAKKGLPEGHVPIHRFLSVPIFDQGRIAAVFCVANKGEEFDDDDASALTAFGNELWRIVAHKKTEMALRESEEKYRLIAENTADHIWIFDMNLTLTYTSPSVMRMKGFTVQESLATPFIEAMTPASAESVMRRFHQEMEREARGDADPDRVVTFETEEYCKDGSIILVENAARLIRNKDGVPVGILGISRDITERKKAEEALLESEERFRQLFNNASDAIILHEVGPNGKPGKILEVNDAACSTLGYTREEFLSLQVTDINTPESNDLIPRIAPILFETRHLTFECTHARKDGSVVPVEVSTHRFTLHNQEVTLAICRDITERKHDEKIREAILSGLKDIFVEYVDCDLNVIWVNQATYDRYGLTRQSSPGSCYRFVQGRDSPCPGCTAKKAIETGLFQEGEVTTPDGHHFLVRSNPVIENGVVTGVIHIAIDITERKRAEDALARSEQRLYDIIDFLPDATFVVDKEGTVIAWNKAIEKMTGVRASDIIGKGNYEYSLPFYHERRPILIDLAMRSDNNISKSYADFQKDGNMVISESIITNFHGNDVILWSIASPLFDKSGWFFGAIESIRDVTDRKNTENALREAHDTLNTVMDSVDALVYVADMTTHEILFINQYGKQICGDVIGKTCYLSLQKDLDNPCAFCTNHLLLDEAGNPTGTITWEFQSTITKRWYQCRDSAIRWIDGRIVRLEIATDITDQKAVEQALRQANRQLTMLSGITRHDILNTINAMQLLFDLIKTKMDPPLAFQEFEHIEKAISLIQSQIEFTRIYQDLGSHVPVWHHLSSLIHAVLKKTSLQVMSNAQEIVIYADPLLVKVFENLADNSVRHGQTVTRILISSQVHEDNLTILFEDDGAGVQCDDKELIFERGYGKNTGFGLFFIREILSLTGITIQETGRPGAGARFEISVPPGHWRIHGESGGLL